MLWTSGIAFLLSRLRLPSFVYSGTFHRSLQTWSSDSLRRRAGIAGGLGAGFVHLFKYQIQ